MTYQANIPQPTNLISVSQNDILQNFQAIDAAWNINHEDFNAANQGKHIYVEMPNQGADPAGAATQMTLFSKLTGGNSQLFYKRDAEGTSYQLTGTNPTAAASGSTFLPGGLLLKWGNVVAAASPTSVSFASAFPTACFSVTVAINNNSPAFSATVNSVGTTGFDLYTTKTGVTHFYIAIGN